jgi:hypothetical protein
MIAGYSEIKKRKEGDQSARGWTYNADVYGRTWDHGITLLDVVEAFDITIDD